MNRKRYDRVYVFTQNSVRAGQRAWPDEGQEESDDYTSFAGSPRALRTAARRMDMISSQASAGTDIYYLRVAQTLREAAE